MGLFDFIKKKIPDIEKTLKDNNFINDTINKKAEVNTSQEYYFLQTQEKLKKRYIAFDIETTGLSPVEDRIIELGAVLFENGEIIKSFSSLVNTDKNNSTEAMRVNNISNEMLQSAPSEREIYPKFLEFLGEAMSGEILMCAHNANFDINFLRNTLERLGYSGKIKFVDTLSISRNLVYGLENYKQATLEEFFNISNKESHRAVTDAEACGKILWQLLHYENKVEETSEKAIVKYELDEYEKILFAYIVNLIHQNGLDIDYLGAKKSSNGYISITCLYNFLKYKFTKNGKYIIVSNKYAKNIKLPTEPCSISEGGAEFVRVYFNSLNEMQELDEYIIREFKSAYKSMKGYINGQSRKERIVLEELESQNSLTNEEAKAYVEKEMQDKSLEEHCNEIKIKKIISRNEITINPINTRIPIDDIKILDDYYDWEVLVNEQNEDDYNKWNEAIQFYYKAIELRQNGKYNEALKNLDIAREMGHITYYLYEEYAMTYHKLYDYDNEIEILEEGMKIFSDNEKYLGLLTTRRDNAVQTIYNLKEKERLKYEKELQKEQQRKEKEELKRQLEEAKRIKKEQPKEPVVGRRIIQMDDNGNIIKKYISISEAVRETGVNSKSIRDAANGIQKHAGGFVWKYEDEK